MEIKIEQMSSGKAIFNNVVLNGTADDIMKYMENFGLSGSKMVTETSKELTHEQIQAIASKIDLEWLIVDHSILTTYQKSSLIECLPNRICKYKVISNKLPEWVIGEYDAVCAYVFNTWEIEESLEYTIAKYNKIAFNRTHLENILKVFAIDGKVIVVLSQYPIRE